MLLSSILFTTLQALFPCISNPCPSDMNRMHSVFTSLFPIPVSVEEKKIRFQERIADISH